MIIEVGKYYRTRGGEVVGPAERCGPINNIYPFRASGELFTIEGNYYLARGPDANDLVELVTPPYGQTPPAALTTSPGYEALADILQRALDQAQSGKGKERHANGKTFDRQPIMEIGRMCGLGYQTGQAQKKTQEAVGMFNRGEPERATAELLGAINYLAAAILLIDESA